MSISRIRKYRISLKPESFKGQSDGNGGKTQGLRVGDIVRRQYFNGHNTVYSLMCVVDYGVDTVSVEEAVVDTDGNYVLLSQNPIEYKTQTVNKQQPWFIGILLEGDVPVSGEILDFVRITNLFDQSRSGALYLTASDENSPFIDIIDGIGRNCSLSWPENINNTELADPQNQYVVNSHQCEVEYIPIAGDRQRICRIKKKSGGNATIHQTFTQYVKNPNQVLVSFWAKSTNIRKLRMSLAYVDDSRIDGEIDIDINTDWKYYIYPITIDYSGRHKRAVTLDFSDLHADEEIFISDFNAILLSSVSNYGEASQIRIGKLNGISDPVFGKLDGYGGYFQKLYASVSTHISGTLTAGDENGFASTFYAGKIHKNAFLNSIEPAANLQPISDSEVLKKYGTTNPTGMGRVFEIQDSISMKAQTYDWLHQPNKTRVGEDYTFSFWIYCKCGAQITIQQNSATIGTINIPHSDILSWHRQSLTFKLQDTSEIEGIIFSLTASFSPLLGGETDLDEESICLFSAPQLESGRKATQYQPTDEIVNHLCNDYGAWFNRGGIGGTIQNPLIRLNEEGRGEISSKGNTFRINLDGSGHIAKGNIAWSDTGDVEFSEKVKLSWKNFSNDVKDEINGKSIKIIGPTIFYVGPDETVESELILNVSLQGFTLSQNDNVLWYVYNYQKDEFDFWKTSDSLSLTIRSNDEIWKNESNLILKCKIISNQKEYYDTIPIQKHFETPYSIVISSSQGASFKNGVCQTILTAQLFQGAKLIPIDEIANKYVFIWEKYDLRDLSTPINGWWNEVRDEEGNILQPEINRFSHEIVLNYNIDNQDIFKCKVIEAETFPYEYPIKYNVNE